VNITQTLKRFETILATKVAEYEGGDMGSPGYDHESAVEWVTDARAALEAVFPAAHAVMKQWMSIASGAEGEKTYLLASDTVVNGLRGVFKAAFSQLKDGYLDSLADGVRAESVGEVLDQAKSMLASNHVVAATVLTGGALETHLRHLCAKGNVAWPGDGSIEKYNSAIGQARNNGNEIYSANDGKQVTAWGGVRNEAAHDPTHFTRTADAVGMMLEGVRQFVARTGG
jgi:hypothetical protein